jgi:hypothetical protein
VISDARGVLRTRRRERGAPGVVPADKWFTRLVVVAAINEALDKLDLKFPKADKEARAALDAVRAQLERER